MNNKSITRAGHHAQRIVEHLAAAYWVKSPDESLSEWLVGRAFCDLRCVADEMGAHVTRFEIPLAVAVAKLIDAYEVEGDEAIAALNRVANIYRERIANVEESERLERNTFDDDLGRKCDAAAAFEAARALK